MITAKEINANDAMYCMLVKYYLEDLYSDPIYHEIMESKDRRQTICEYLVSWIPWDDKISTFIFQNFTGEP